MSDIVEQLRTVDTQKTDAWALCEEAADEIERLREELKHAHALADTLRKYAGLTGWTPLAALGEGK